MPFLFGTFIFGQAKTKVLAKRRNTDNPLIHKQNKDAKLGKIEKILGKISPSTMFGDIYSGKLNLIALVKSY